MATPLDETKQFDLEYCKTVFLNPDEIIKFFPYTVALSNTPPNISSPAKNISDEVLGKIELEVVKDLLTGNDKRLKELHQLQSQLMSQEAIEFAKNFLKESYLHMIAPLWYAFCEKNVLKAQKVESYQLPEFKEQFEKFVQDNISREYVLRGIKLIFRCAYNLNRKAMRHAMSLPLNYTHGPSVKEACSLIRREIASFTFTLVPDVKEQEDAFLYPEDEVRPPTLKEHLGYSLEELKRMAQS